MNLAVDWAIKPQHKQGNKTKFCLSFDRHKQGVFVQGDKINEILECLISVFYYTMSGSKQTFNFLFSYKVSYKKIIL